MNTTPKTLMFLIFLFFLSPLYGQKDSRVKIDPFLRKIYRTKYDKPLKSSDSQKLSEIFRA